MLSDANNKKSTSWALVIIALIIFWPIGLYLFYKKVNSDKTAALKNSQTLNVIGYIFTFLAIFYFIMIASGNAKDLNGNPQIRLYVVTIFFAIGGSFMLSAAKKMKQNAEKCKKYISVIANENQTSIDDISKIFSTNYDQVFKDLNEMIDKGYFQGSHIDINNGKIILQQQKIQQFNNTSEKDNSINKEPKVKEIKCKNCGANNKFISGETCECEFCGSILSDK
ncbi:hypothetical protein UT300005_11380 [Clostridium sp. CTA-5]